MKRWVGAVPIKYKEGTRQTLEEGQVTVGSVIGSSSGAHGHAEDVPIVEEEDAIEEEDAPWDLHDLRSKDDRGSFALQRVQKLCKSYGLEVPFDVRSVQKVIQDALESLASGGRSESSLSGLKTQHAAEKSELEKSLKASEYQLSLFEHRVHELELKQDTVDSLARKLDEIEKTLKKSEDHVQYLADRTSEQSNQLLSKDAELRDYQVRISLFERHVADLTKELNRSKAQNATDKDHLEGVRTALAVQKATSQQCNAMSLMEREKLIADKAVLDVEFQKYRSYWDDEIVRLQASVDREKQRADEEAAERERLFLSEKRLKAQLRHRPDDSKKVEGLQYELDGVVAKERRAQSTITSFQSQLSSVRGIVEQYRQRLPEYTDRFAADLKDNCSVFLYDLLKKAQEFIRKQRDDTEWTVRTNLEAIDSLPRSLDIKLSRPGPSS